MLISNFDISLHAQKYPLLQELPFIIYKIQNNNNIKIKIFYKVDSIFFSKNLYLLDTFDIESKISKNTICNAKIIKNYIPDSSYLEIDNDQIHLVFIVLGKNSFLYIHEKIDEFYYDISIRNDTLFSTSYAKEDTNTVVIGDDRTGDDLSASQYSCDGTEQVIFMRKDTVSLLGIGKKPLLISNVYFMNNKKISFFSRSYRESSLFKDIDRYLNINNVILAKSKHIYYYHFSPKIIEKEIHTEYLLIKSIK